ncbi:MAG: RDD family protein [Kiritimatiellae bacterium]|nr:RDD family protein [Kiritimatiellia bacterium]
MSDAVPRLEIRTPEGVVFSLPLAGPVSRMLAWLVDLAAVAAIVLLVDRALALMRLISPDTSAALRFIGIFVVSIGYGIALEWRWRGETIGKRLLHIRVVDRRGLRLSREQVVLRNLLRAVDQLPIFQLVGGVAAWLSPLAQRLGDIGANTVVVCARAPAVPDLERLEPERFNSLRERPDLEARLRRRLPPAAAVVALRAVLRRAEMDADARAALFAEIAADLRALCELPREHTAELSDEQLVRNVVDSYFRGAGRRTPTAARSARGVR